MSSVCTLSPRTHHKTSNLIKSKSINGKDYRLSNRLNERQELLNNLKLIKEKMDVKVSREMDRNRVLNKCFSNDLNGIQEMNCFNKKSLQAIDGKQRKSSPIIQINSMQIQFNAINNYEDMDEDNGVIRAPLLRSTSLNPFTPHRKKIVRFADAIGLNLESVRHIISDELPTVPKSAFGGYKYKEYNQQKEGENNWQNLWSSQKPKKCENKSSLLLEFIQPSSLTDFMDRVRNNKVCLENCMVSNSAGNLSITCIIRVLNVSFEKSVTLRYTLNEWLSANEALASYIPNSCDGFSDKFSVTFSVSAGGYSISNGQRLKLAIKYAVNDEEFWDNNKGANYSLIYRV